MTAKPARIDPKANSLTTTPSLTSTTTTAGKNRITTLETVPKRSFLCLKAAPTDTESEMMPPPPMATAKAKTRARSRSKSNRAKAKAKVEPKPRGRSTPPERKAPPQAKPAPVEDRSRSVRSKIRMPIFTSGQSLSGKTTIVPLPKPSSPKEAFLQETVSSYRSCHKLHSAADFNLMIASYLYEPSPKWPVTTPWQMSSQVLKQDSSEHERFWCYRCDLGKGENWPSIAFFMGNS